MRVVDWDYYSGHWSLTIGFTNRTFIMFRLAAGLMFFRICGRGLWFASYRSHQPLFSERYGYRVVLFRWTNWWRVCWLENLKPIKTKPQLLRLVK